MDSYITYSLLPVFIYALIPISIFAIIYLVVSKAKAAKEEIPPEEIYKQETLKIFAAYHAGFYVLGLSIIIMGSIMWLATTNILEMITYFLEILCGVLLLIFGFKFHNIHLRKFAESPPWSIAVQRTQSPKILSPAIRIAMEVSVVIIGCVIGMCVLIFIVGLVYFNTSISNFWHATSYNVGSAQASIWVGIANFVITTSLFCTTYYIMIKPWTRLDYWQEMLEIRY